MDSIDWAVSRGPGYQSDNEKMEMLKDDNVVPEWNFAFPEWWEDPEAT